jgi:hypothetical protein
MACNLPVITRRFRGLEQAFTPGTGLEFINHTDDILAYVEAALHSTTECHTREMVHSFSWSSVVNRLQMYYERLVAA